MDDNYVPKINDYVRWRHMEGWVYFVDSQYVTIEIQVTPKDDTNLKHCPIHQNNRVLVVCQHWYWNELVYVKSRSSKYETTLKRC